MPLIAYSEFVSRVLKNVFPDTDNGGDEGHLEPTNLRFPHRTYVQNALIKVQTMVECLRQNNVNTFTLEDAMVNCGVAVFTGPEHIRPAAVYAYKPAKGCTRVHYEQKSVGAVMCYVDQFASGTCSTENDICNAVRTGEAVCDNLALCDDWDAEVGEPDTAWLCEEKFFAVGAGSKIYTAPRMPCGYRLAVHWEGIKYRYADDDLISDDPDLLDVISAYVQAERARTFDRDLALYRELLGKGPPINGREGSVFHVKLIDMAFRCKEERRVRKRECLEMWDDSAIGAQVDPLPARDESGIEFEQCDGCPEGQVTVDGECVDCLMPMVSIAVSDSALVTGESVTVTWNSSNVIDHASSKVYLDHGETSTELEPNEGGSLAFTPTEDTTYTIRAVTPCGDDVSASVTVTVTAEGEVVDGECACPQGLPECLELDVATPSEIFEDCFTLWDGGGDTLWNGQLPLISECRWGYEFPNDLYIIANGPTNAALSVIVEMIECNPMLYRLTFTKLLEGEPVVVWQGESVGTPYGPFVLTAVDGCDPEHNPQFSMTNCVACTQPTVRFDPPAGSRVSLPSVVFLHASIANSLIYYGIDEEPNHLYSGPISLADGQVLKARAVSPTQCIGEVATAGYVTDTGLVFHFLCDGPNDESGVFGEFEPNYETDDYHWRIIATRAGGWTLRSAKIYETNEAGVWVTGQAWATEDPIYPVEMDPDPFAVYPLVLFENYTQVNTDYGDPVDTFGSGVTTLEGYGQPFVPLVGYFRLEFRITEGASTYTIYKLISHACPECEEPAVPTLSVRCSTSEVTLNATVEEGSIYRIWRWLNNNGAIHDFEIIEQGVSATGAVEYVDGADPTVMVKYYISKYCEDSDEWLDSPETEVLTMPSECCIPGSAANLFLDLDSDVNLTFSGSGVVAWGDQSGEGNDPTMAGSPQFVPAQLNGKPAVRFTSGSSGVVTLPVDIGAFTLIGVKKMTAANQVGNYFSLGNFLRLTTYNLVRPFGLEWKQHAIFNGGTVAEMGGVTTAAFSFVIVYSCSRLRIYINAVKVVDVSGVFNPSYYTSITLGQFGVDEFRLKGWSGVRTDAEFMADAAAMRAVYALP